MNDYDRAITRMETARAQLKKARASLTAAEDEMERAEKQLTRCETSPGIPLPQYRTPDYSQIPGYGSRDSASEIIDLDRAQLKKARASLTAAEDEMERAEKQLTRCETSPGIPLPQYRTPDYSQIPGYGSRDSASEIIDLDAGA